MRTNKINFEKAISYVIQFLLGENVIYVDHLHYLDEDCAKIAAKSGTKDIYIIASSFFTESYGKMESLVQRPLETYRGEKILFGEGKECEFNGNIFIYADIVASSYYILSRYEEYIRKDLRDKYGNFPAEESVLYKNNILERPIVDSYTNILGLLLEKLGYKDNGKENHFSKIYFTHDIDVPFKQYNFMEMVKTIGKSIILNRKFVLHPLLNYIGFYANNPRSTWKEMLDAEREFSENSKFASESICFIIASERNDEYTVSYINDKKTRMILQDMFSRGAIFGLHTSYSGASDLKKIVNEKKKLEYVLEKKVYYHRNHYLRQLHPADIIWYENAGFTDDFTTGFNEIPGFRLGTCHPVRWINPVDASVHNIILHGLHIMDGSLIGKKPYQQELNYTDAKKISYKIISEVYRNGGELCILWHNGMFEKNKGNYLRELYYDILDYCNSYEI